MADVYNTEIVYVISDIHNDYDGFNKLLNKINFYSNSNVVVYILGDIFDRGSKPLELIRLIQEYPNRFSVIKGNHDVWLARQIEHELCGKSSEYISYNTYELLKDAMTREELLNLAKWILALPSQIEVLVNGKRCLLAHAKCFPSFSEDEELYYLNEPEYSYFRSGIEGYDLVVNGHTPTDLLKFYFGIKQNNKEKLTVLFNSKRNCAFIDTGNGFINEYDKYRLSALCLNDNSVVS